MLSNDDAADETTDASSEEDDRNSSLVEWGITIAVAVCIAVFVHFFVGEPFIVPTGSMLQTIQLDDRLWGEKLSYRFRSPEPGEIVMFDNPDGGGTILVKRCIARAGQTVDLVDGRVVVDGTPLDEPYVSGQATNPITRKLPGVEPFDYPLTVPEGKIWVMGDNRGNSLDSRYFGPVDTSTVIARAVFTFWPPSDARWL